MKKHKYLIAFSTGALLVIIGACIITQNPGAVFCFLGGAIIVGTGVHAMEASDI